MTSWLTMQVNNIRWALQRTVMVAWYVIRAAVRNVGAAGGGWALLATFRAAAEAVAMDVNGPVPQHIAVIMDGNRRFGRREHGDSLSGHAAGGRKLNEFVEWCVEAGVKILTVFAFSTENWKRDPGEVEGMMSLFLAEVPRLGEHVARLDVRVRFLVSEDGPLPLELKTAMHELEEKTARSDGLQLNVCLSYGGRGDVLEACKCLAREAKAGKIDPDGIDEGALAGRMLTGGLPDPDVLIRTSGEKRLSNFLMFQLAYAELFFLDKHWPEVTRKDLNEIITKYQQRHRRFGK